jgi:hypothetical protein
VTTTSRSPRALFTRNTTVVPAGPRIRCIAPLKSIVVTEVASIARIASPGTMPAPGRPAAVDRQDQCGDHEERQPGDHPRAGGRRAPAQLVALAVEQLRAAQLVDPVELDRALRARGDLDPAAGA